MQTPEGVIKMRQTMIKKHGSEEAYKEFMRNNAKLGGSKGSKDGTIKGFATLSPEKLKEVSARGGSKSRIKKA